MHKFKIYLRKTNHTIATKGLSSSKKSGESKKNKWVYKEKWLPIHTDSKNVTKCRRRAK